MRNASPKACDQDAENDGKLQLETDPANRQAGWATHQGQHHPDKLRWRGLSDHCRHAKNTADVTFCFFFPMWLVKCGHTKARAYPSACRTH